ncbi:MAG: MTH1187 family thiamine-binding protein [Candidatus Omnitrophica bacterium]|nr:MTH1187 family thiamine-binding protein [Candidatus Omnitrophota bacterium]
MAIMEVKILPLGTKSASVCEHIVNAVKVLKRNKIKCGLTSMGTIVEGKSAEKLLSLAGKMHKAALAKVDRVVTFIELDERTDKKSTIKSKLRSVKERLKYSTL